MLKISVLMITLCAVIGSSCFAYTLTAPQKAAYAQLKDADGFALGGIGAAGTLSRSEIDLHVLLAHPQSALILQDLWREAKLGGQLYALLGLRFRDKKTFDQKISPYLSRQDMVQVVAGCTIISLPVGQVATRIQHGDYDDQLRRGSTRYKKSLALKVKPMTAKQH